MERSQNEADAYEASFVRRAFDDVTLTKLLGVEIKWLNKA